MGTGGLGKEIVFLVFADMAGDLRSGVRAKVEPRDRLRGASQIVQRAERILKGFQSVEKALLPLSLIHI